MTTHSQATVVPREITLALGLFILWIVLSGHWDPWLLGAGLGSVLLVVRIAVRMDIADHEGHPIHIKLVVLLRYWVWLLGAVVKSALDVSGRILDPKLPISPQVIVVRSTQGDDIGRAMYANSITLTPGTVSIDVRDGLIEVHALTEEAARELQRGDMNARISKLYRRC